MRISGEASALSKIIRNPNRTFKISFSTPEGMHSFNIWPSDSKNELLAEDSLIEDAAFYRAMHLRKTINPQINNKAAADLIGNTFRLNFFGRRSGKPYLLEVRLHPSRGILKSRLIHASSHFSMDCANHDSLLSSTQTLQSLSTSPITTPKGQKRIILLSVDSDYNFYRNFSSTRGNKRRSVRNTRNALRAIVNRVNAIYSEQLNILIRLQSLKTDHSNNRSIKSRNSSRLLNRFREFTVRRKHLKKADIYHLFTGNALQGSVVGLAYVGSTCRNNLGDYSFGLTRITHPALQALVTAHEIAHNLGANHIDGTDSIMSPVLSPNKNRFISQSIEQIFNFIQEFGICLNVTSA